MSRLSEVEAAYLAGFFDGEGHVRWTANNNLRVFLAQNDPEILHWVQSLYGGGVYPMKKCFQWETSGAAASAFLDDIGPYVRVKKQQVRDVLDNTPPGYMSRTGSLDEREARQALRIQQCRDALTMQEAGTMTKTAIVRAIADKYDWKNPNVVFQWLDGHRPRGWRDPMDMS